MSIDLRSIARALGGDIRGRSVLAPGPGHSPRDRSMSVTFSVASPDGFIVHSHAGDDWRTCRDYIRERLGMDQWQPGDGHAMFQRFAIGISITLMPMPMIGVVTKMIYCASNAL